MCPLRYLFPIVVVVWKSHGIYGGTGALWDKTRSFWDIKNSLSHKRGSERSERASERTSERSGGRERSEQSEASSASERCERMSERTSEWPSTYVSILVCSRPQCMGCHHGLSPWNVTLWIRWAWSACVLSSCDEKGKTKRVEWQITSWNVAWNLWGVTLCSQKDNEDELICKLKNICDNNNNKNNNNKKNNSNNNNKKKQQQQ